MPWVFEEDARSHRLLFVQKDKQKAFFSAENDQQHGQKNKHFL